MSGQPPVALITGGAGDLACAIHDELAGQGWKVHAPSHATMDVTDRTAIHRIIPPLPRLDLLIHAAGGTQDALMLRMTEAAFAQVLAVHLKGAFLCAQAALKPMLRQREGHILTIGSHSALSGPAGQANYAAAKAGLIALTQSIAAEYGAHGIRANCVLPGFLETRMTRHLLADAARHQGVLAAHTLGRLNTIQDAARFIAFLHGMKNVSGQVFQLDSRLSPWA